MLQGLKIWKDELYMGPKIWGASSKGGAKILGGLQKGDAACVRAAIPKCAANFKL